MLFELSTDRNKCFTVSFISKVIIGLIVSLFLSLCLSLSLTGMAQNTSNNYSADMYPMIDGTEVQILTENFLGLVTTGRILQGRLELNNKLVPTQKVQIIFSNAQTGEVGILPAIVDFEGNDLLIPVTNNSSSTTTYISLHTWLTSTKGITLNVPTINN